MPWMHHLERQLGHENRLCRGIRRLALTWTNNARPLGSLCSPLSGAQRRSGRLPTLALHARPSRQPLCWVAACSSGGGGGGGGAAVLVRPLSERRRTLITA